MFLSKVCFKEKNLFLTRGKTTNRKKKKIEKKIKKKERGNKKKKKKNVSLRSTG